MADKLHLFLFPFEGLQKNQVRFKLGSPMLIKELISFSPFALLFTLLLPFGSPLDSLVNLLHSSLCICLILYTSRCSLPFPLPLNRVVRIHMISPSIYFPSGSTTRPASLQALGFPVEAMESNRFNMKYSLSLQLILLLHILSKEKIFHMMCSPNQRLYYWPGNRVKTHQLLLHLAPRFGKIQTCLRRLMMHIPDILSLRTFQIYISQAHKYSNHK